MSTINTEYLVDVRIAVFKGTLAGSMNERSNHHQLTSCDDIGWVESDEIYYPKLWILCHIDIFSSFSEIYKVNDQLQYFVENKIKLAQ